MKVPEISKDSSILVVSHHKFCNSHDNHLHNFFELIYVLSGERCFFINGRTIKVKIGDLLIIPPNTIHKAVNDEKDDCEGILLYYNNPIINLEKYLPLFSDSKSLHQFSLALQDRSFVEELLLKMINETYHRQEGSSLLKQSLAIQLFVFLERYIKHNDPTPFEHPSPMHEKISEIALYINANYAEDLSLETLAEHFFISASYLSRIFKKVTNFTLIEYINNIRIKEAKRLLIETNKKILDISEEVGFGSITHFGRVFKEITGNSPKYYRK